jgi:hypothetical protein
MLRWIPVKVWLFFGEVVATEALKSSDDIFFQTAEVLVYIKQIVVKEVIFLFSVEGWWVGRCIDGVKLGCVSFGSLWFRLCGFSASTPPGFTSVYRCLRTGGM